MILWFYDIIKGFGENKWEKIDGKILVSRNRNN